MNTDGSWDTTFDPEANGNVLALVVQADGKIVAGGGFTKLGGLTRISVGRLNPDGSLDPTFDPGASDIVNSLALQTDGRILVGGAFTILGGQPRSRIGRLNTDGSLDMGFSPAADGTVYSLAVQADGRILAAGSFTLLDGQPRNGVGRLSNSETSVQNLTADGNSITWLRGGAGPEVWRTGFEVSTNGSGFWTSLGAGTRIAGGWELAAANLPGGATLRARGFVSAGRYNGSGYFVESTVTIPIIPVASPVILVDDDSFGLQSNLFGFSIRAAPGQILVIEASTNLVDWIPVETNLTTGIGLIRFSDPNSLVLPYRFYRAWVTP
jgi:uncharacterized delta-60 repeat protein